jgi:predicted AAA+ superfamily ATPase
MIRRKIADYMSKVANSYPVVTIMGPRQSGKTTLAQAHFPRHVYRNLEAEDVLAAAKADARKFLMNGEANMVIDEIQRFPALLTYIQEIVDARRVKGQFVLTGSHQPELGAAVSESLAGRTGICTLMPLCIEEMEEAGVAVDDRDGLMWSGFMPRLYNDAIEPTMLYRDYFQTYVQRDVRRIVNIQDLDAFTVFMRLLAGRVGQLLNKDSLARDVGISAPTVMKWLSVLESSYVIYRLRPYYVNFGKRQTKASKIYFTETGLAAYLIGIREREQLFSHPLVGSLFENMVVMEAVKFRLNRGEEPDLWFYRNSSGTVEVDLLMEDGVDLRPREIKSSSTYSQRMGRGLSGFLKIARNVTDPLIVYAGETFDGVAANFRDVSRWC